MSNEQFTNIKSIEVKKSNINTIENIGKLCLKPYRNRPKGCPNYGKPLCPPNAPKFEDIIKDTDLSYFRIIYNEFDVKMYIEKWKKINPKRTINQIKCCLYWQKSVKNELIDAVKILYNRTLQMYDDIDLYLLGCGSGINDSYFKRYQDKVYSMEATGINVFSTLKTNNVFLEVRPENKIRLCCMVCSNKRLKHINIKREINKNKMF